MMHWPINPSQENSLQTLELRQIVEAGVDVWAFDYPSYYKGDEKTAFEKKVLDHFWMRQIGSETVGRFLHYFRRTVREIMPFYIQRYKSVELMDDPEIKPLENYSMIEEYTQTDTQNSSTEGSSTSSNQGSGTSTNKKDSRDKKTSAHSDTPQGEFFFPVFEQGVSPAMKVDYASDITQDYNIDDSNETSTASESGSTQGTSRDNTQSSGQQTHKLTRRGNIGVTTYAQMLEGYRATFLNIDMEIINELESCFLEVF